MNTTVADSALGKIQREELDLSYVEEWLASGMRAFALLDACDEPLIPPKVHELGVRAMSLYQGAAEKRYAHIAPYVAEIDLELVEWIVDTLAGTPWGYLLLTGDDCSLISIRRHLRKFLLVTLPDGQEVFFRFYDPRLISPFIDAATESNLKEFFGPVNKIAIVDAGSKKLNLLQRCG